MAQYNPTPINWSVLGQIGENLGTAIGPGSRMRDLRNQFASGAFTGPNGELDYDKMIQALGAVDPVLGAKTAVGWQDTKSDAEYREALLGFRMAEANKPPEPTTAMRDAEHFGNMATNDPNNPQLAFAPRRNTRPLSRPVINDLTEKGEAAYKTRELAESFRDEYGGWKGRAFGDAANYAARTFGVGDTTASEWWQNYNRQKNVTRNKLFGSALTSKESGEWEKADVNPGMEPEAIKANLAIQRAATERAARKLARVYMRQGASPELIEEALGFSLEELEVAPPSSAAPQDAAITPAPGGHVVRGVKTEEIPGPASAPEAEASAVTSAQRSPQDNQAIVARAREMIANNWLTVDEAIKWLADQGIEVEDDR